MTGKELCEKWATYFANDYALHYDYAALLFSMQNAWDRLAAEVTPGWKPLCETPHQWEDAGHLQRCTVCGTQQPALAHIPCLLCNKKLAVGEFSAHVQSAHIGTLVSEPEGCTCGPDTTIHFPDCPAK